MRRIYFIILFILFVSLSFFFGTKAGDAYPPELIIDGIMAVINNYSGDKEARDVLPPAEEVVESEPEPVEDPEPDIRSVNLIAVGNIFPHIPQIEQAHIGDGVYDFSPSFEFISPYLQATDLAIGDLETAQAGPDITFHGVRGYTGFPLFNSPQELSVALRDAGMNVMTLGNNHALDRGLEGLMITLDHLYDLEVVTFGAYKSPEERDTPTILDQNGIKIALIGYTYSTNGIPVPEDQEYCVNFTPGFQDIAPIIADINKAREYGADLIAVFPHWGDSEYAREPQPQYLRQVAEELAAAGADLVIGGHPKFIQPLEWFFHEKEDGSQRATLAVYSQGTFLSNQHYPANVSPLVEYSLLLDIDLTKNMVSGETRISAVDYDILWIHRTWRHRILPLSDLFAGAPEDFNLSADQVEERRRWYNEIIETIDLYGYSQDKARAMALAESLAADIR